MSPITKNLVFWGIIFVILIFLFQVFYGKPRQTVMDKNYSDFIVAVENNQVLEVEAQGRNITWKDVNGKKRSAQGVSGIFLPAGLIQMANCFLHCTATSCGVARGSSCKNVRN